MIVTLRKWAEDHRTMIANEVEAEVVGPLCIWYTPEGLWMVSQLSSGLRVCDFYNEEAARWYAQEMIKVPFPWEDNFEAVEIQRTRTGTSVAKDLGVWEQIRSIRMRAYEMDSQLEFANDVQKGLYDDEFSC